MILSLLNITFQINIHSLFLIFFISFFKYFKINSKPRFSLEFSFHVYRYTKLFSINYYDLNRFVIIINIFELLDLWVSPYMGQQYIFFLEKVLFVWSILCLHQLWDCFDRVLLSFPGKILNKYKSLRYHSMVG